MCTRPDIIWLILAAIQIASRMSSKFIGILQNNKRIPMEFM